MWSSLSLSFLLLTALDGTFSFSPTKNHRRVGVLCPTTDYFKRGLIATHTLLAGKSTDDDAISSDDLMPGDIICWSSIWPDGSYDPDPDGAYGEIITLLTGDPFIHASIIYRDTTKNAEQADFGARIDPIERYADTRFGKDVVVHRIKKDGLSEAVFDVAQKYVDREVGYGNNQLYRFAALLAIRNPKVLFTHSKELIRALIVVLRAAGSGDNVECSDSMFCSQFVYQCFAEAGYDFKIKDRTIGGKAIRSMVGDDDESLLEATIREVSEEDIKGISSLGGTMPSSTMSVDEAAVVLRDALTRDAPKVSKEEADPALLLELKQAIIDFALMAEDKNVLAASTTAKERVQRVRFALDRLAKMNMVTPGDLTRIINEDSVFVGKFKYLPPARLEGKRPLRIAFIALVLLGLLGQGVRMFV